MYNLTIIVPHYNSVSGLEKLLDTIPKRQDIQTLIIDDKSTKDLEELQSLKEKTENKHTLFFKNNTNKKGAGVCRNIGLKNAEGKWLLFADSDDFFLEDFYTKVSHYFDTYYEIVYFSPNSMDLSTGELSDRHQVYEDVILNYLEHPDKKSENNLRYKFYVPWSKLIRRNFLMEYNINFDEVITANDVMFSTKMGYQVEKFKVSKEKIYCVTRDKGSLTTKVNKKAFYSRLNVWVNFYKYLEHRLPKDEFEALKLNGRTFLVRAVKFHFNIKEIFKIYNILRKNGVKLLDKKDFNPIYLFNILRTHYDQYNKEKKYYSK